MEKIRKKSHRSLKCTSIDSWSTDWTSQMMATEQHNFPLQKSVVHPTHTFGFNSTPNNEVNSNSLVRWAAFWTSSLKDAPLKSFHKVHQKCTCTGSWYWGGHFILKALQDTQFIPVIQGGWLMSVGFSSLCMCQKPMSFISRKELPGWLPSHYSLGWTSLQRLSHFNIFIFLCFTLNPR